MVDLGQPGIGHRTARGGQTSGFGDLARRVSGGVDQAVVFGVPVQATQRGNKMLGRAAPATGVTAGNNVDFHVFDQLFDLRRGWFVEVPVTPALFDAVPVGTRRVPTVTATATIGMYWLNVGTSGRAVGAAKRSSGDTPIRASSSRAAFTSADAATNRPGRIAALLSEITIQQCGVARGEQIVQRGRRVHDAQVTLRVGGQQNPVTWDQVATVSDRSGQAQVPLPGHAEHAVIITANDQKPSRFADVQGSAGHPA